MKKQNNVAIFLTGKVISIVARHSNIVFSPASINAALTMVAASSEEEKLKSFIFTFLQSSSINEISAVFWVLANGNMSGGPKIAAVNGVWMEQSLPFSPSSKDLLVNFFKADFAQVDFQSKAEQVRMEVNKWASNHTNSLIKEILPRGSVTSLSKWIYGNALYFKGVGRDKFSKSLTRDIDFYLLNGGSVSVPFMCSSKERYIAAYDGFKVLKLCYRQDDDTDRCFSMYFFLSDEKDELDDLLERMTSTPGFLDTHIPKQKNKVATFGIPKFEIEVGFEASNVFDEMNLEVSLYQKSLIKIDEEGTEAVTFTVVHGRYYGCRFVPTIDFVADHPLIFLIREDMMQTKSFYDRTRSVDY